MNDNTQKFDCWCLVELFGHAKIAGRCTEQNIAGTNMLRVDVPETKKQPAFTRLFGSGAIYAINPIDELTAKMYAENLEVGPIQQWQSQSFIEKMKALPSSVKHETDEDDFLDPNDSGFIPEW